MPEFPSLFLVFLVFLAFSLAALACARSLPSHTACSPRKERSKQAEVRGAEGRRDGFPSLSSLLCLRQRVSVVSCVCALLWKRRVSGFQDRFRTRLALPALHQGSIGSVCSVHVCMHLCMYVCTSALLFACEGFQIPEFPSTISNQQAGSCQQRMIQRMIHHPICIYRVYSSNIHTYV